MLVSEDDIAPLGPLLIEASITELSTNSICHCFPILQPIIEGQLTRRYTIVDARTVRLAPSSEGDRGGRQLHSYVDQAAVTKERSFPV